MKKKKLKVLAFILAILLAVPNVSIGPVSAAPVDDGKYILDASADLTAFAAGAKADGDTQTAGTEDYFTLIYSSSSKIDSSSKTFSDNYTGTQRINFGGSAKPAEKNVIKFTTENPASVKIWWVCGGDGREIDLFKSDKSHLKGTTEGAVKNSLYISTLEIEEAGTYYLGGKSGNNYIFKVEITEEIPTSSEYILDASADLTAFAAGAKADGDTQTAGTEDYFTLIYSSSSKIDSSSKTFSDNYAGTQRINFGGSAKPAEKNVIKFTTENPASVKVWWVCGGDGREIDLFKSDKSHLKGTIEGAVKNSLYISTLEIEEAGTYYLGGKSGNNYIFKVAVTETSGSVTQPPRADWSGVSAPVITAAVQEEDEISVTVSANIDYDGADKVIVTMYKADEADGEGLASKNSMAEQDTHTLKFKPSSSGDYKFKAVLSREDEEDKVSELYGPFTYVLPLAKPGEPTVACIGSGAVKLEWAAVKEAEKYLVTVDGTDISKEVTGTSAIVENLTLEQTYTFKVAAMRGSDTSEASSKEWKVIDTVQRSWSFSAFGPSTNTSKNIYTGMVYDNNLVVESTGGKGKLQPGSVDGIAFYYTAINPETENFTLAADITVDEWTFSNGQEGFGMMAADAVGTHGSSSDFWNNSYMATVTKVEYKWNSDTGKAYPNTENYAGGKYSMFLGVGAQEKIGITPENIAGGTMASALKSTMWPLDITAGKSGLDAGNYNIVGNYTNADAVAAKAAGIEPLLTTFHFEMQRNNTGYIITYKDMEGRTINSQTFYHGDDGDALTKIDADNIYVGFFASRNAVISIKNVSLTTIHPDEDAPRQERPIALITPNYLVESSTISNSKDYELVFYANADGTLKVTGPQGVVTDGTAVTAGEKNRIPVVLDFGKNNYTLTFTPDPTYQPEEYTKLSSYDTAYMTFGVTYKVSDAQIVYVSPTGSYRGAGTKERPFDIYTAVKYAAPGQKIYLMEGVYNLNSTVMVERGINGTPDDSIYLMADPEAASRPVFDFGGNCAGMVIGGDYWYLQGFDVTKSAPGQKGLQISGDNNVVDDVDTYRNGNTGIQISRLLTTDQYTDWPANNLILNCTSYLNADPGYEDADGFAAKLTVGDGNVFDGCIAAYNADDGWDLYAKVETGRIGAVTIRNSIAFKNGYDIDADGNEINAGNGNGFKMGGSSITGYHVLENSAAFANKAKGIDSNSCPDIQVRNCISFNNGSYNVAFYTNSASNTDYSAVGIISYKDTNGNDIGESIKPKGSQDNTKIYGATNYYFFPEGNPAGYTQNIKAADNWFVHLDTDKAITSRTEGITRNADGTIDMNGYLELTDQAASDAGADMTTGTPSEDVNASSAEETVKTEIAEVAALIESGAAENDIKEAIAEAVAAVEAVSELSWKELSNDEEFMASIAVLEQAISDAYDAEVVIVHTDESPSIQLTAEKNAILSLEAGKSGRLVVTGINVPRRYPAALDGKEFTKAVAVDITFEVTDGVSVLGEAEVLVPIVLQFAKPDRMDKDVRIYYYAETGAIEEIDTKVNNGIITASVSELGTFVITNLEDYSEAGESQEDNTAAPTQPEIPAAPAAPETPESGKEESDKKEPTPITPDKKPEKEEKPEESTEVKTESTQPDETPTTDANKEPENNTASDNQQKPEDTNVSAPSEAVSNNLGWLLILAGVVSIFFVLGIVLYNNKNKNNN